jgi:ligand-binding sensor domain-containing protein
VKRLIPTLCCCLVLAVSLCAQAPVSWPIGEESGLSSSEIYCVHQDRKGYLWVASNDGLFRYNGKRFDRFDNPRFRGVSVSGIQEDRQGRIWCHSFRGQIFHSQGDSLALFALPKGVMHVSYVQFVLDSADRVWLTANDAIYEIDVQTNRFKRHRPNLQGTRFLADNLLTVAPDKNIWACVNNEWCRKTPLEWQYFPHHEVMFRPGPSKIFFLEKKVLATKYANNKTHWFELGPEGFRPFAVDSVFSNCKVYRIEEHTEKGVYWLLSNKGAWLVDENLLPRGNRPVLEKKSVSDVLFDREGLHWMTTLEAGLFTLPDLRVVGYGGGLADGWPDGDPTALESDRAKRLFVGYQDGTTLLYEPLTGRKENWTTEEPVAVEALGYHPETDAIWQAQISVYRRSAEGGKWQEHGVNNGCKSFAPLPGGMMGVAGSSNYLVLFDGRDSSWLEGFGRIFPTYPGYRRWQFSKGRCWRALVDSVHERFLVAYNDSLVAYTGRGVRAIAPPGIKSFMVRSLAQTADGTVWVGSLNEGLFSFWGDSVTGRFQQDDGFPPGSVRSLLVDGPYLWVATENALVRMDWRIGKWCLINRLDGLPSVQIQQMALVGTTLYLLTAKGLVSIDARAEYINDTPPMVYLAGVTINERDTLILPEYNLSWDQRGIRLYFDVLALRARGEFNVQYRFLGRDSAWVSLPRGETMLNLSGLDPGAYLVEVRALNEDGLSSESSILLPLRIRVPFWLTGWFLSLAGLSLAALLYLIYRIRLAVIRRRDLLEKELRSSKLAALRAQMNPHFMFNSLNSIQEFVLTNDKRSANLYLSKFASLTRLILEHSDKELIPLDEEILLLGHYLDLEGMRFDGRIQTEFSVDPELTEQGLVMPSMIVQPFVENAFKHGLLHLEGPGRLRLSFSLQKDDTLRVEVEDNGIGRKKAGIILSSRPRERGSFSTGAAHTRLTLLNLRKTRKIGVSYEDLEDQNGMPLGTKVVLLLPLEYRSFQNH